MKAWVTQLKPMSMFQLLIYVLQIVRHTSICLLGSHSLLQLVYIKHELYVWVWKGSEYFNEKEIMSWTSLLPLLLGQTTHEGLKHLSESGLIIFYWKAFVLTEDSPTHNSLRAGWYGKSQSPFYQLEELLLRTELKAETDKSCFLGPFAPCTIGRKNSRQNGKVFILG